MADSQVWKVYSEGRIKAEAEHDIVVEKITEKFKASPAKAQSLISQSRVLVSTCRSEDEAKQYLKVLEDIGVVASIDYPKSKNVLSMLPLDDGPTIATNHSVDSASAHSASASGTKPTFAMKCPKCAVEQDKSNECISCGIIIAKYQQRQLQEQESGQSNVGWRQRSNTATNKNNNGAFFPVLIGTAICLMLLAYFMLSPENGVVGSTALSQGQMQGLEYAASLPHSTADEVKQMLDDKDYAHLEKELLTMFSDLQDDIQWEYPIMQIMHSLSSKHGLQKKHLNDWVAATDSDISYLARAYFYANEGWISRGQKYSSDTSDTQVAEFRALHEAAYEDFMRVKSHNKHWLPVYTGLLNISRSQRHIDALAILEEAIQYHPGGFSFRHEYAVYVMPKWFGSQGQQDEFSRQTQAYLPLNPRLSVIMGYKAGELGRRAKNNKNIDSCIEHYNEALSYGVTALWLHKRAYCLMKDGQYEAAVADADLSLQLEYHQHVDQIRAYSIQKI